MIKNLDTRTDLVAELERYPRTPLIEQIIAEAKAGEFHDFKNEKYDMPKVELVRLLREAKLDKLAKRVINGDFDEPADETDKTEMMGWLKDSITERKASTPPIPRFQGKVGQASDPPEMRGKWFFTIWVSFLGHGEKAEELGPIGPWDTEEKAHEELLNAIRLSSEDYEKRMTGESSGEYIDMKTNTRRKWTDKTH